MNPNDFVLLAMLAMGGEIQGKTKFQKTVYFLGLLTGCIDDLGYRPHFYGPYSDEVAYGVGRLRTIGAADLMIFNGAETIGSGFETWRHDYRFNEGGKRFAEETARRYPDLWPRLKEAADLLKEAGELDYVKMSIASKTHFMLQETNGQASGKDLDRLATRFGWDVTPQQVKEAGSFLERIGLARIRAN